MLTPGEVRTILKSNAENLEQAFHQVRDRCWETDDTWLAIASDEVMNTFRRLNTVAEQVKRTATNTLERVKRTINIRGEDIVHLYCGLNSLGELQSTGPQFDIAVAMYYSACERFEAIISDREREEERLKKIETFKEVNSNFRNRVVLYKLTEAMTVKQIAKAVGWDEGNVNQSLAALHLAGVVEPLGSRYWKKTSEFTIFERHIKLPVVGDNKGGCMNPW